MSVRVVARIRPLLDNELDKDIIVHAGARHEGGNQSVVRIPSPKNMAEEFTFAFNGVYDQSASQEDLFTEEVAPHVKSLFQGFDVTIFAYGVTGTGKTHTMRGGMKLADRGIIPRLLSSVYRRAKKMAKDTDGETTVTVSLAYYEIYNDKVYDLLEPPEKRTPSGLPLREANGKTQVVGLSERPCEDLRDFERLYIEANQNRVTASTKLNAHSSRSHAILRVRVVQTSAASGTVRESTASAIDLAGSEDNRRTDNGRERLVESAAINKSLFVLSQCIDAIGRGDKRIPFRESKMTRILSLGQNQGITVMVLNLAPLRSYHLDTLSSLNVSSRAKRIEVREIENEVVFKQPPRIAAPKPSSSTADKPEKPVKAFNVFSDKPPPPAPKPTAASLVRPANTAIKRSPPSLHRKRPSEDGDVADSGSGIARPSKITKPGTLSSLPLVKPKPTRLQRPSQIALPSTSSYAQPTPAPRSAPAAPAAPSAAPTPVMTISAEQIEAMVEKKVQAILAERAAADAAAAAAVVPSAAQTKSAHHHEAMQRRLEALERRVAEAAAAADGSDGDRSAAGLRHLLAARQHRERGDDAAAMAAYELARPCFPAGNRQARRLAGKMERLRGRIAARKAAEGGLSPAADDESSSGLSLGSSTGSSSSGGSGSGRRTTTTTTARLGAAEDSLLDYDGAEADDDDETLMYCSPSKLPFRGRKSSGKNAGDGGGGGLAPPAPATPEIPPVAVDFDDDHPQDDEEGVSCQEALLDIVNSRDAGRIQGLEGFGPKRARDLVDYLDLLPDGEDGGNNIESLEQLRAVPGMGARAVDMALEGLSVAC